jgi:hypothetical protein
MKKYKDFSHSALMDLLVRHTALYTQMLAENIKTDEFYRCKRTIDQLTAEIESRNKTGVPGNPMINTPAQQ